MNQYIHPDSGTPISGMRLVPGTCLRKTDRYPSSDGKWQEAPCADLILRAGCPVIWIRQTEFSPEGQQLLEYLTEWNFMLTQRSGMWLIIPSPRWKHDGRMQWEVQYPRCIQELLDYGLIKTLLVDDEVYELTELGRQKGLKISN